jgi:hypothetical protein
MCEALADLKRTSGVYMTRKGYFNARPPAEAVERLRGLYRLDPDPQPSEDRGLSVKAGAADR